MMLYTLLALVLVAVQHFISTTFGYGLIHDSSSTRSWDGGEDKLHANSTESIEWELQHKHVMLPRLLEHRLANVDEPLREGDIPYFFHTPRTMGQSIKDILGICFGKTTTNLTATILGIRAARRRNIFKRGDVDFIVTQYLHEGAALFNARKHRAR